MNKPHQVLVWSGSLATVLLGHSLLITAVFSTWSSDSFHTLSVKQQIGLAAWSVLLIFALFWLSNKKTVWVYRLGKTYGVSSVIAFLLDLTVTTLMFIFFYSVSPQIYYFYYQQIIPDLPNQWIISSLFDFAPITQRLLILPTSNYSDLLAVLTYWTLLCSVIWRYLLVWSKKNFWVQPTLIGGGFGLMSVVWNLKY